MRSCIGLSQRWKRTAVALVAVLSTLSAFGGTDLLDGHDHMELDAALVAPYQGEAGTDARSFTLKFAFPSSAPQQAAHWQLQLRDPQGVLVQTWAGKSPLAAGAADVDIAWAGRVGAAAILPDGIYRVSLRAFGVAASQSRAVLETVSVEALSPNQDYDVIEQAWDIRVGNPPLPVMPEFNALRTNASLAIVQARSSKRGEAALAKSAPALGSLPYTVYFGNLHSQTNHSDGGGAVSTCTSSQGAQTGAFGPVDAFPYARDAAPAPSSPAST